MLCGTCLPNGHAGIEPDRDSSLHYFFYRLAWLGLLGTARLPIKYATPESVAGLGVQVVSAIAAGLQPLHLGPDLRRLESKRLGAWPFSSAMRTPGPLDEHGLNPLPHPFN